MKTEEIEYQVEINGGPTHALKTKTGDYALAAMAALAMLDFEKRPDVDVVKIWVSGLLPDYGPYFYFYGGSHGFGIVVGDDPRMW